MIPGNNEAKSTKPETSASKSVVAELLEGAEQLKREASDLKDKYLRAVAENENGRRRMERERSELLLYGNEGLLKDLIPVLDCFDRALAPLEKEANESGSNGGSDPQIARKYLEGLQLIKSQLIGTLGRHGLEVIRSHGERFDPNCHQAVMRTDDDNAKEETVNQELATGYKLNGRLLRPAMVSVKVPRTPPVESSDG